MRRRAARLLHVLLSVPVVTAAVIAASPIAHAQGAPAPLVVVIDPGHGGVYDPSHPQQPYDPGAISPSNGIEEKDEALAVSLRVRELLQRDDVDAILTRSTDIWLTIQQRSDIANADGAADFVSVHFNGFTDPAANGSLVLYPKAQDLSFAQTMSSAMADYLGPLGMSSRGATLRDNWWIHTAMPTVTVEPAFLSNAHDAAVVATAVFKERLAQAIRAGIESFDPQILQRKAEIVAWNRAHPSHPVAAAGVTVHTTPRPAPAASGWLGTLVRYALVLAVFGAVVRWPGTAWDLATGAVRLAGHGVNHVLIRRAARRRRRRATARRTLATHAQRLARPRHIYDELY